MPDVKFLKMTNAVTGDVFEHDGYKTLMRQLADPNFRAQVAGDTLVVNRAGKPFIKITIDNG